MDEKLRFATLAKAGRYRIVDLRQDFGISRKTGRKRIRTAKGVIPWQIKS